MEPITSREVLPFASGVAILPGQSVQIRKSPEHGPLMLERFYISAAGTPCGARDWIVNDIEIDGVSQLSEKNLPGVFFGTRGIAAEGGRASAIVHFSGLDAIERESEVAVTVTYAGPNADGVPFFAAIVGPPPAQRPTVLPIAPKVPIQDRVTISAQLDAILKMDALEIDYGDDWVIHDIRVDGATQFKQPGEMTGSLFRKDSYNAAVFMAFSGGRLFEIDVQYRGPNPAGIPFVGRIDGTVVRDDYAQPPPDVKAVVGVLGRDDLNEEVIAKCNWRAPYVRPEPTGPVAL